MASPGGPPAPSAADRTRAGSGGSSAGARPDRAGTACGPARPTVRVSRSRNAPRTTPGGTCSTPWWRTRSRPCDSAPVTVGGARLTGGGARRRGGQDEVHPGATAGIVGDPDGAAVPVDDLLADRQAQTGSG